MHLILSNNTAATAGSTHSALPLFYLSPTSRALPTVPVHREAAARPGGVGVGGCCMPRAALPIPKGSERGDKAGRLRASGMTSGHLLPRLCRTALSARTHNDARSVRLHTCNTCYMCVSVCNFIRLLSVIATANLHRPDVFHVSGMGL